MPPNGGYSPIIAAVNAGGVVAVLVIGLWLGLTGAVVPGDVMRACQMERADYLDQLLRYQVPVPVRP